MIFRIFTVILLFTFVFCKKEENKNHPELIGLVLLGQTNSTSTVNCDSSLNTTPSFAKIVSDGKLAPCAACHRGRGPACPDSDLDVYDYSSVTAKVNKGKPESSFLYLTASAGAMKQYSNAELNQLLYTWIKNCAPK